MSLPYSNASSGGRAMQETMKYLRHFGCSKFGHMVDEEMRDLVLQFEWQGKMVSIRASYRGYAAAWLRENPWTDRRHSTEQEWTEKAMEKGSIAVYSVLRDWIKGQLTAVETGILTFEGAFLGQIMLPTGHTVLEHVEQHKLLEGPQ